MTHGNSTLNSRGIRNSYCMYSHICVDQQRRDEQVVSSGRGPNKGGGNEEEQSTGQDALVQPQLVMANGPAVFGWCGRDDTLCDQVQLAHVRLGKSRPEQLTGHVCGIGQSDAPGEQGLQPASRSQHTSGHSLSERVGDG